MASILYRPQCVDWTEFFIVLSVLGTVSVTLDLFMVDADGSVSFIDQVIQ